MIVQAEQLRVRRPKTMTALFGQYAFIKKKKKKIP